MCIRDSPTAFLMPKFHFSPSDIYEAESNLFNTFAEGVILCENVWSWTNDQLFDMIECMMGYVYQDKVIGMYNNTMWERK